MPQLKELLVDQLQDLLDAETQLTQALPKLAQAASHPKLKEAFEKHLSQTEEHVDRLRQVFELIGEKAVPKPCKAMKGLIEEGQETIENGADRQPLAADLALIAAAQKVEHYEIACYGTVRSLARQIGEYPSARLLSHTLGEEESADFLLTAISEPLTQQVLVEETSTTGNREKRPPSRKEKADKSERVAS